MTTRKQPSFQPSLQPCLQPNLQPPRPGSPTGLVQSSTATSSSSASAETKLLLWIGTEKTTPFSPSLFERMARVKMMHTQWSKVIERMRNVAQTNPAFRGERLVPSAVNAVSDRQQLSVALRDASLACFDNIRPLGQYVSDMADAEQAISGYQDVMLRQVMLFAVKPLKDYLTIHYPKILAAYAELEKKRDKYDAARVKRAPNTTNLQQQLCDQAAVLEGLFNMVPEQQIAGAKAIDTYVRAERQFFNETVAVIKAVRRPEHKSRWATT